MIELSCRLEPMKTHFINPHMHSVFGEMMGRVIYDGTWVGRDSTIPHSNGIRLDVVEGLKEAGVRAIRWPGGCFADHYHWKDGIGKDRRKRLQRSVFSQSNDFGTDEFIELCRLVGAEPILVANVATGTPEEFLDWFEYCNGQTDTKYGSLRAANGHSEPYDVCTWGLGNTDDNVKGIAYNDPKEYGRNFLKWRAAIRDVPEADRVKLIGLGLSARHEVPGWVEGFLDYATFAQKKKGPDHLSVHRYIGGKKPRYEKCGDAVDYSDEAYYFTLDSLKSFQLDIDLHREYIRKHTNQKYPTKICFDEWGLCHPEATNENGVRQRQTMRDGIFAACCLHLFYRNSDIVEFAMETQYSNVLQSLFETNGEHFFKTPTFHVFKLFKDHLGKYSLPLECRNDGGDLDCHASTTEDVSKITLTMVNKSLSESHRVNLPPALSSYRIVDGAIIAPENVRSCNSFDAPERISDAPYRQTTPMQLEIPKHSIMRLALQKAN